MTVKEEEFEAHVDAGIVYGYSLDDDDLTVTYFVNDNEPLPPFPAEINGYRVTIVPIPPPSEGY